MRYTKFFAMDIVRRNPKSFLSEKVGLLIIESRILIFKRWLVVYDGLASPGLCITKAITFEKRIPHFRNSIAGHRLSEVLQNQMQPKTNTYNLDMPRHSSRTRMKK